MDKYLEKFTFNLILFFPFLMILGIFTTQVISLSIILISLYLIMKTNKFHILNDKILIFLFLFSLYIGLNALLNGKTIFQLSTLFYFRFAVFSTCIFFILYLKQIKIHTRKYSLYFLIFSFILLDAIYQFIFGYNFLGFEVDQKQNYGRIAGLFEENLILGSFLLKFFPIILITIILNKFDLKRYSILYTIFFSIYFLAIFLSGERTAFFLLIVFLGLSIIFIRLFRKIFINSLIIFSIIVTLLSYFKIGEYNPTGRMFFKTFHEITNQKYIGNNNAGKRLDNIKDSLQEKRSDNKSNFFHDIKFFSKNHEGHFKLALHLFSENKIFGTGPEGFRVHCGKLNHNSNIGICSVHPHNLFLQILSELGLIGIIFYFIAATYVIYNFFKIVKINSLKMNGEQISFLIASLAVMINFFPFVPSGNFFNTWISIIIYYTLGFYLYLNNKILKK